MSLDPDIRHLLDRYGIGIGGHDPLPVAARADLLAVVEPGWEQRAACIGADPEAWFPRTGSTRVDPAVTRVCARCPVRRSCLAAAVAGDEHGVWGGTRRGQRLHARARLIAGHPTPDVLAELAAAPMPRSDYTAPPLPDLPAATLERPAADASGDGAGWRESA